MATQLKFVLIQGGKDNMAREQYNREFFSFIGTSPTGGLTRVSLYPYSLSTLVEDVKTGSKKSGKEITSSPAEKLLLELVGQLHGEPNAEKRASLKHKFDALYSFAVPEQSISPLAFEEGKKEANAWMRGLGFDNIVRDYSASRDSGSVDQHGNILTIFSRESEAYYSKDADKAFSWQQREAMNFLLNRLNAQMEAVAKGVEPVYDPHTNFDADLVREAKTMPSWIEKEKTRQARREKYKLPFADLNI